MKKTFLAILAVSLLWTMVSAFAVNAAGAPIVFDFSVEPTYAEDPATQASELGAVWRISWADGLAFMGKNSKARISYAYDATEKASVFTAYAAQHAPYFVAVSPTTFSGADMPAQYQIDTSKYQFVKIKYKASSAEANVSAFFWVSTKDTSYGANNGFVRFTVDTSNTWVEQVLDFSTGEESAAWRAAGVIKQLRFDTYNYATNVDGDKMAVKYIAFFETKAEAEAYGKPAPTTPPETQPETGDNNNVFFLVAIVIAMLAAVVVINRKKIFN